MNQDVLKQPIIVSGESDGEDTTAWRSYLPAAFAIGGSFALTAARMQFGGAHFISDGALMMLALACYLVAATFYLTNFYAPFRLAEKLGMWAATFGVFFNLSSWLVRWVAAFDRELEIL